jgi:hypothetical protein
MHRRILLTGPPGCGRDVKTFIVTIENRGALPAQLAAMLLGATD